MAHKVDHDYEIVLIGDRGLGNPTLSRGLPVMSSAWSPNPPSELSSLPELFRVLCDSPVVVGSGIVVAGAGGGVQSPSGKPHKGELNFSYKWGEKVASAPAMEINTAYPAQVGPSHISPAPQPGYANPPPPQNNSWWAKLLGVELVKLCLGDVTADCFGSDPGVLQ